MQLKEGQKVYRVRGPDGWWLKKKGPNKFYTWVEEEHEATIWRNYAKLKKEIQRGILSRIDEIVGIVNLAHLRIVEYTLSIKKTGLIVRASDYTELKEKTWLEETLAIGWKK